MAAPTNPRVESNSLTTAIVRWTYTGVNNISVWRSLVSGSGFVEVTTVSSRVQPGTTQFEDTGLTPETQYFYKVSDDAGGTFSSEVSVVTQSCMPAAGALDIFSLPRQHTGGGDPAEEFQDEVQKNLNNLAERVEAVLHGRVLVPGDCVACPENGALVLNCAGHCKQWLVIADEDINSISLQYCDEGPGTIDFIIPPGETRRIDGWPAGFGFTGDEGFQAPVSGGTDGRTVSASSSPGGRANSRGSGSRNGMGRGTGPSGSGGGSGCSCVTNGIGALTIKSCNANNSLDCQGTKKLKLIVCGGRGPYTWSNTGSVSRSSNSGTTINVTPPPTVNNFGNDAAYWIDCYACSTCADATCTLAGVSDRSEYNCSDTWISALPGDPAPCDRVANCTTGIPSAGSLSKCCQNGSNICPPAGGCFDMRTACPSNVTAMCDKRTAGMISDGCNPCGLQQGSTVTVTDSMGTQTTIILRA